MTDITKESLVAILKEALGPEVAERQAEAQNLVAAATKQHGSIAAATAAGEEMDLFKRYGLVKNTARDDGRRNHVGRYVRLLAEHRGNWGQAAAVCKARGDIYGMAVANAVMKAPQYLNDFATGGALVPEDFSGDFVELLYNELSVVKLGATVVDMPSEQLTIPVMDTGSTAHWVAEGQIIAPSNVSFGQLQLNAKKLAAIVPLSNDLIRVPSASADMYIEQDMRMALNLAMDAAILRGDGVGKPKGVENFAISGHQKNIAGATLQNKVDDLLALQAFLASANVPLVNTGYILNPRTVYALQGTLAEDGAAIFAAGIQAGTLMGQRYVASNQVPANLSGTQTKVYFGAWSNLVIGRTGGVAVEAFPNGSYHDGSAVVSGISTDSTPIRAMLKVDTLARQRGKEFAILNAVTY